jgi:chromosome segregation ATPase
MKNIALDFVSECRLSGESQNSRELPQNIIKIDKELLFPNKVQSEESARQVTEFFASTNMQVSPYHLSDDAALKNCKPSSQLSALAEDFNGQNYNSRLREDLIAALIRVGTLEREIQGNSVILAQRGAEIANLDNKQSRQAAELHGVRHEKQRLSKLVTAICEKMAQLESKASAAMQKCISSNNESLALRAQLDLAHSKSAELSKQLLDLENALNDREAVIKSGQAKIELMQAEASIIQKEKHNIEIAMTEAEIQHSSELNAQRARFESQISQMEFSVTERNLQIRDFANARSNLLDHHDDLITIVSESAKEISSETKSTACLESQLKTQRENFELRIGELIAELKRERLEHSATQNASAALRMELAGLLPKLAERRHLARPVELNAAMRQNIAA